MPLCGESVPLSFKYYLPVSIFLFLDLLDAKQSLTHVKGGCVFPVAVWFDNDLDILPKRHKETQ